MAEDIFFLDDFDPDDLEFLSNLPADVSVDLFMTMKECALGRHFRFVQRLNVALRLKARVRATTWLRPNYPREPTFGQRGRLLSSGTVATLPFSSRKSLSPELCSLRFCA